MTAKLTWKSILPKHINNELPHNCAIDKCIQQLKQAEKEGKICINPPESVFINHIKSHLKEGEFVICKICGKDVAEIYAEHLLSQGG